MGEGKEAAFFNGIGSTISQLESAVSASLRPMPTETGDGTYIGDSSQTGLAKDLSHVDLGDVRTLVDVVKKAATGEPVDDKKYIMERVIQVGSYYRTEENPSNKTYRYLASCWLTINVPQCCGAHQVSLEHVVE